MTTNASPNDKVDSEKYSESDPNFETLAMTPQRTIIPKSESMPELEGSGSMPWKTPTQDDKITPTKVNTMHWKTPTDNADVNPMEGSGSMPFKTPDEHVDINPRPMPAQNEDSLLFPPPNLVNAALETPILSNVRRTMTELDHRSGILHGARRKSSLSSRGERVDLDKQLLKSVSFGKDIQSSEHEIVFNDQEDEYGQFYNGSIDGSPSQKISASMEDAIGGLVNMRNGEEEPDGLSIPDLAISKQRISFKTRPGHRRFNSNISEISLESDEDPFEEAMRGINYENYGDGRRIVQNSNRRLSLAVDMETGRSPNRSSQNYLRGQQAMRRVYSNEMLDAQSPRVRRRRAMSYNIDQFRKGLSKRLSLPSPKSFTDLYKFQDAIDDEEEDSDSDDSAIMDPEAQKETKPLDMESLSDHSRESVRLADKKRRKRYNVEQFEISDVTETQRRRMSESERKKAPREVQYRLSAITPVELRRRRYRDSLTRASMAANSFGEASEKDVKNGAAPEPGTCGHLLEIVGNFLIEVIIFIVSKGKENYSVGVVNKVLFWTFRKNLIIVLLAAACSFYVFTVIFATFIFLYGLKYPHCIHINGVDFDGEDVTKFVDAFALSWTTFSTVGYGLVFPGTTATMENSTFLTCTGMSIITTMEAFFGILFSGFWGAIWFAKVTRVSSFAQVSFSDAIVIKYGTGVTGVVENAEYEENSSEEEIEAKFPSGEIYKQSKLPCPIFEFRIANRLHRQKGGEIIDACINIVASMEESQSTRTVRNGAGMEPMIRRKGRRPKRSSSKKKMRSSSIRTYAEDETKRDINVQQAQTAAITMIANYIDRENKGEDRRSRSLKNSSKKFPNQIFAKLNVESLEHPFFKRVWNVRHVLDGSSPLLKPEAKELIRINNGHWPQELNNATAVRASIQFDQILVSFSGTSNVDANSVYSQNAYDFEDMCVGYAFCNMLFREANGSIGVDHRLLNDVKEQSGGGGEELHFRDQETSSRSLGDIFIL